MDLVITNSPQLVPRVEVIPGLSDHDAVYFEFVTKVIIKNGAPHKIALYDKANWDQMRTDMRDLETQVQMMRATASVEELWSTFKNKFQSSMTDNIPHKTSRPRTGQPWITTEIRRLMRKRDRKHKQMKKTGSSELKT